MVENLTPTQDSTVDFIQEPLAFVCTLFSILSLFQVGVMLLKLNTSLEDPSLR